MTTDLPNPTSNQADLQDQAREWWVRVHRGNLNKTEQRQFQLWLSASPSHQVAFDEVGHFWQELDGIKTFLPAAALTTKPRRRITSPWQRGISALAACMLVFVLYRPISLMLRADERTGIAETRTVQLADGSTVLMNSETALAVNLTSNTRELELLQGEAQFTVSPDPSRPFRVRAGNGTVTALGTAFNIHLSPQGTDVTVTQHRVAVKLDGESPNAPTQTLVDEGQQVAYASESGLSAVKTIDTHIATAWQQGKLIVQDRPLGEVIAELNHYHRGYFLVADPAIAQHRINGVFYTGKPIAALNAIEAFQHLKSTRLSHYLVLLHR
jgi:transmembrane sensor